MINMVAMACNWAPHNLYEVEQAIYDYMDGKEPMLPGPDFPTGGEIINKADIPNIMRTGKGSVRIRGRYNLEGNNIVFYEIPYGINTEALMKEIGDVADEKIPEIDNIRNESNKKGFRLVIECERGANLGAVVNKLFRDTDLETTFSYNQVGLINKTPTELNLKDCIKIYVDFNNNCIVREAMFDIKKATERLHIIIGLIKAMDIIDEIIAMIKAAASAAVAKQNLQSKWGFSEAQAKAILDMKLSKLAKLEKESLETEKKELEALLLHLQDVCLHPDVELRKRLQTLVNKYGDKRRTILSQIEPPKGEDKEIAYVEPEECVVILTCGGLVKRVPKSLFKTQNKGGKGVKTQDDITLATIRTNSIDNLLIFSDKGKVYRLLVDKIPTGTNTSRGVPVNTLTKMSDKELPIAIYSQYRGTDMSYLLIATKSGLIKKTALSEFANMKGVGSECIKFKNPDDDIAAVTLIKDEQLLIITEQGMVERITSDFNPTGRTAMGVKGITLKDGDKIAAVLPIRDEKDKVAIFSSKGLGKKVAISEFSTQGRGGKGITGYKPSPENGIVTSAQMVNDEDMILISGNKTAICISCKDIPECGRTAAGNIMMKTERLLKVTKV